MQVSGTIHAQSQGEMKYDKRHISQAIKDLLKTQFGIDVDVAVRVVEQGRSVAQIHQNRMLQGG